MNDDLIGELYQEVADHSETHVLKSYLAWDCLLIHEIGYDRGRTSASRVVLHPDASAPSAQIHPDHLQPGL
jgi:hypothetical protein